MIILIDDLTGNAHKFAIACYDMNDISELRPWDEADETDCKTWGITPEEWKKAVTAARNEMLAESADD